MENAGDAEAAFAKDPYYIQFALAEAACNRITGTSWQPRDATVSFQTMRYKVRTGKLPVDGPLPKSVGDIQAIAEPLLQDTAPEIHRICGYIPLRITPIVQQLAVLTLREATEAIAHQRKHRYDLLEPAHQGLANITYMRSVLLCGELAVLQHAPFKSPERLALRHTSEFLLSLLDRDSCDIPQGKLVEIIEHNIQNPRSALLKYRKEFQQIEAAAHDAGVALSKSNILSVISKRTHPTAAISDIQHLNEKYAQHPIIQKGYITQASVLTNTPEAYLEAFAKRAEDALAVRAEGLLPQYTESQLIRLAFRSPRQLDELLETTARPKNFTPESTDIEYEAHLTTLREINETNELRIADSFLKWIAKKPHLSLEQIQTRWFAESIRLRFVPYRHVLGSVPIWLARLVIESRQEQDLTEAMSTTGNAATLMNASVLQAATIHRPEETSAGHDPDTCHYLAFPEKLQQALKAEERRAILALYNLDDIFYGASQEAYLQNIYGEQWREHTRDVIIPHTLQLVTSLFPDALPGALLPPLKIRRGRLQMNESTPFQTPPPPAKEPPAIPAPEKTKTAQPADPLPPPEKKPASPKTPPSDGAGGLINKLQDRHRILAADEEVELAKQIEAGLYAEHKLETNDYDLNNQQEREELEALVAIYKQAFDAFVFHNILLVRNIAGKRATNALDFDDYFQDGLVGLMLAIKKFDYKIGNKFSTYATWWVRQAINRGYNKGGRLVRIPVWLETELHTLRQTERNLGPSATLAELADALNLSVERVTELKMYDLKPVYTDEAVYADGEGATIGDLIFSYEDQNLEDMLTRVSMKQIHAAVAKLPAKQAQIITLRFGLHGTTPHDMKQVAAILNMAYSTVKYHEKKAHRQLRFLLRSIKQE